MLGSIVPLKVYTRFKLVTIIYFSCHHNFPLTLVFHLVLRCLCKVVNILLACSVESGDSDSLCFDFGFVIESVL